MNIAQLFLGTHYICLKLIFQMTNCIFFKSKRFSVLFYWITYLIIFRVPHLVICPFSSWLYIDLTEHEYMEPSYNLDLAFMDWTFISAFPPWRHFNFYIQIMDRYLVRVELRISIGQIHAFHYFVFMFPYRLLLKLQQLSSLFKHYRRIIFKK